jgi:hypothetical protein
MIGLLLLGLVGLTGRSTFAAPIADRGVTVTLLQDPDQAVPPGGIFTYTIKVANHGPGWAYDTSVRILLDPNVEVLDFVRSESNGYVDYLGADAVSVMFRHLEPVKGAQARIVARVRPDAPANLKISSQAQAIWSDNDVPRTWKSNTITMMVGPTKDSGFHGLQQPMLTVPTEPVAAGTPILIGGNFFGQEERVTLWVHAPGGDVVDLSKSDYEIANMNGVVVFFVGTTKSAPAGTYSVVAHGLTTGVEGVGTFTIR